MAVVVDGRVVVVVLVAVVLVVVAMVVVVVLVDVVTVVVDGRVVVVLVVVVEVVAGVPGDQVTTSFGRLAAVLASLLSNLIRLPVAVSTSWLMRIRSHPPR